MTPKAHKKLITMTFPEAIKELITGARISRLEWSDNFEYGYKATDGYLSIFTKGKAHRWLVSDGDMEATDWFVLPEQN